MKKRYALLILILILIPGLTLAQARWTLEQCIDHAWKNNLKIKQQEISVEQNENNLTQAKLNFAPSVRASLSHSMNWGRSVNVQDLEIIENKLSQSTSASASAAINLFEGMVKHNDIKSKNVVLEISKKEVDRIKNDISIEITRSFLQILLSKEVLNTAIESQNSVKQQVDRTKKLVDAGSLAYSALLEIEAQLASESVQVVNASNQLSTAKLNLAQLLDLEDVYNFEIDEKPIDIPLSDLSPSSVEEMYHTSQDLPQIQSSILNIKNSDLQLAIARGRAFPSISFSAGYGTYYADSRDQSFFDQFNENKNPSLSFGLSIPIFNNYQVRTSIKNAKLGVRSAQIEHKSRQQMLYKEIQQANNDALSYLQRYLASQKSVDAMKESFRYVQEKFDLGVVNAIDYTVAKTNLFRAQSELIQSKYQYMFQVKILDFYKGLPISL